jgi:hypothetical protein
MISIQFCFQLIFWAYQQYYFKEKIMKRVSTFSALPTIALAFTMLCASPHATADLLGDLNQALDVIKKVGDVLPDNNESSTVPTSTPSVNKKIATPPVLIVPQNLSLILSQPQYYYERPQYFSSLGFELGEYITVQPLDKDTFNPLYIPSYKGIPRLVFTPDYKKVTADISILKTL